MTDAADQRPLLLVITTGSRKYREYLLASIRTRYRVHLLLAAEPTWEREYITGWTILSGLGDTVALRGLRTLADGVWSSDEMSDGYAADVSDVEHASEFVSDTAPALALYSDDPAHTDRLRPSARHFEELWTGITPGGRRHFKSAWFSASALETDPPKDRDVNYNARATKALRFLAHETGDAHVIDLLHEWSLAWAHAATRTDKGKPPGILPASIRFPDEAINGDEPTWYDPNMYWDYFRWAHDAGTSILDQLFHTYILTKDEALLQPLFDALDLVRVHENVGPADDLTPGSAEWAAANLRDEQDFWTIVETWRLRTDDDRYDDRPRRREKSSSNTWLILGIIGGVILVVLAGCGGLIYWAVDTTRQGIKEFSTTIGGTMAAEAWMEDL